MHQKKKKKEELLCAILIWRMGLGDQERSLSSVINPEPSLLPRGNIKLIFNN